jgi:hypothetical protein
MERSRFTRGKCVPTLETSFKLIATSDLRFDSELDRNWLPTVSKDRFAPNLPQKVSGMLLPRERDENLGAADHMTKLNGAESAEPSLRRAPAKASACTHDFVRAPQR